MLYVIILSKQIEHPLCGIVAFCLVSFIVSSDFFKQIAKHILDRSAASLNAGKNLLQNLIIHGCVLVQEAGCFVVQQIEDNLVAHTIAYMGVGFLQDLIDLFQFSTNPEDGFVL